MNSQSSLRLLIFAAVLAIVAYLLLQIPIQMQPAARIMNFDDCAAAGYPIRESYPAQCSGPDGKVFTEKVSTEMPQNTDTASSTEAPTCVPAGCSGSICAESVEASSIVTTCIYKAEYSCYKTAKCERQWNGQCGWTQTPELEQCTKNPPSQDSTDLPQ